MNDLPKSLFVQRNFGIFKDRANGDGELLTAFCTLVNALAKGSVTQRPKYWGNLVMKLIYAYLDPDVAKWLKDNAPKPQKGQNYHQWLTSQYGLKKLVEHIWMVMGVSKTCHDLDELKH